MELGGSCRSLFSSIRKHRCRPLSGFSLDWINGCRVQVEQSRNVKNESLSFSTPPKPSPRAGPNGEWRIGRPLSNLPSLLNGSDHLLEEGIIMAWVEEMVSQVHANCQLGHFSSETRSLGGRLSCGLDRVSQTTYPNLSSLRPSSPPPSPPPSPLLLVPSQPALSLHLRYSRVAITGRISNAKMSSKLV